MPLRSRKMLRGDGQALPPRLKAELTREPNRLEFVISQLAAVEDERDRALNTAVVVDRSRNSNATPQHRVIANFMREGLMHSERTF